MAYTNMSIYTNMSTLILRSSGQRFIDNISTSHRKQGGGEGAPTVAPTQSHDIFLVTPPPFHPP